MSRLDGASILLDPYPSEAVSVRPISRRVNNAAQYDPRCVEPADSVGRNASLALAELR
ncbi:MAG: hypothetical protein OXK81_05085 [Chloroflexota bacterium]|nr:hypothetical protein [Chloroflexota bacterium]